MVKPGEREDSFATEPTAPAPADPTRTSEPLPADKTAPTPPPEPRPLAPSQLRDPERYQIIAEHGRGGLGRVSRAHDRELGRDVAIKELLARGHVGEVRFLREALITARLEHPGIVPVHEAGRWPDGTPFYAMKLVSGRPLRELITERATVEERIGLLHHVIAVADAIAYAHGRNIIHRDLKPANVIVGEFGETIVIDWGLAKDLTAAEELPADGGPFRTAHDDGLTAAGSILGTPAYMAPEQLRGEHADRRADVFAIGAMLWELCAVDRLSTTEPALRRRVLRRAGIDQDLIAIIAKALEADPARRYPDAGALAADLKAFKSGARIAARQYSLLAMLAHWIRRHRAVTVSASAALVVAVAGIAAYVRNIAVERDRADVALERAEATKNDLVLEHAALTLKHAQLLLTTDPSAALDALATYHGADHAHANQLGAEAVGRGTALLRAVPHTDNILWAAGTPDGDVVTLSSDHTISRTSRDGRTVVLARGVTPWPVFSYAPSRHLLAYSCDPADLCLLDVFTGTRVALAPAFRDAQLASVGFSPGGSQLAMISRTGVLRVFDVAAPDRPVERLHVSTGDGQALLFGDEETITVGTKAGILLVRMDGKSQTLAFPDGSFWSASPIDHRLAIATTRGQVLLFETDPLRVATRETPCHSPVSGLAFLPGQRAIAYACREGTVGIWDLQTGAITPRTHLEGHADMLAVSAAGDYLLAAGGNGTFAVIDLETNLVTSYQGHGFRLTTMAPPTPAHPFLISGDVRGGLRVWPLPDRAARVVAHLHTRFVSAMFDEVTGAVVATTLRPKLTIFSTAEGVRDVEPHVYNAGHFASAGGGVFATYGTGDVVELWSSPAMTRRLVLDTHHGAVAHLAFVRGAAAFVTAGQDGRLVRWTLAGEPTVIARFDQPIVTFARASATGTTVVGTADGALWRVSDDGRVASIKAGGARVTQMLVLPDATSIFAGHTNGDVLVIDTRSGRQTPLLHAAEAIQDIALTADGRTIAVASNDGVIHVGVRHDDAWTDAGTDAGTTWTAVAARARQIALTSDGLLVAVCTDGTIWLYSATHRTWRCLPTGTADLIMVVVTADEQAAAVFDTEGRLIWLDLEAARKAMGGAHEPVFERRLQK